MSLRPYIAEWGARFDTRALRPPPVAGTVIPGGPQPSAQTPLSNSLLAWCQAGSGPGNCRWWQPGGQPVVAQRMAVATLQGPDEAALRELADALARQLDGFACWPPNPTAAQPSPCACTPSCTMRCGGASASPKTPGMPAGPWPQPPAWRGCKAVLRHAGRR